MNFRPYRYPVQTPRAETMSAPVAGPSENAEPEPEQTKGFPASVSITSLLGEAAAPTQVVQKDEFLFHPYECSFQRLLVSGDQDVAAPFTVQLIQVKGGETTTLTEEIQVQLRRTPEVLTEARGWEDGPVFLRVKSAYSPAKLLATIHVLTEPVL